MNIVSIMLFSRDTPCTTLYRDGCLYRGAKVVLYLALTQPKIAKALISLENAPIASQLSPTFKTYVEGMKAITAAKLTKRKDAEDILEKYEEVPYLSIL